MQAESAPGCGSGAGCSPAGSGLRTRTGERRRVDRRRLLTPARGMVGFRRVVESTRNARSNRANDSFGAHERPGGLFCCARGCRLRPFVGGPGNAQATVYRGSLDRRGTLRQPLAAEPPTGASVSDVERSIRALRLLAEEAGCDHVASDLEALERRGREGRFYVAVVGQPERGKSALLNALVGSPLLPVGSAPTTATVTLLRPGPKVRVTIHYRHAGSTEVPIATLPDFLTDTGNPGNVRSIRAVEVETPSPALVPGLCLVDTPGMAAVIGTNLQETDDFVPHVDALLLVLGADPPLSAQEIELLRDLPTPRPPLLVVVNKADLVGASDIGVGVAFIRRVLSEAMGEAPLVLVVSACAALEHRPLPDGRPDGGLADLRALLDALARSSGAALVRGALEGGFARAQRTLAVALELERRALAEPVEDLGTLERTVGTAANRITALLEDFSVQLREELARFGAELESRRDEAIAAVVATARRLAMEASAGSTWNAQAEQAAYAAASASVANRLRAWERDFLSWVDTRQRSLASQFTAKAQALLANVHSEAEFPLKGIPLSDPPAHGFAPAARHSCSARPDAPASDVLPEENRVLRALLPEDVLQRRLERRLARRIEMAARRRITRVTGEVWIAADDSRCVFEYGIARLIQGLRATMQAAVARARGQRARGAAAIATGQKRLAGLLDRCTLLAPDGASGRSLEAEPGIAVP